MGRDSRRRADLRTGKRQPTEKEERRAALKAQRRGRRCGNTLPEYETLAAQGEGRVYAALIARHAARMDNIAQSPAELREVAYDVLAPIMCFDVVLRRYKTSRSRHPSSYGGTWIDHLAWGVDSMVASIRLLLSGQFIGAALIARHQLKRWSQNRAFTTDTPHRSGESSLDYIARVWSADSQPQRGADETANQLDASTLDLDDDPGHLSDENVDGHTHMTMSDGTEICPSAVMGILSEILHTREGIDAVKWDTADLCAPGKEPPVVYAAYLAVTDALRLCSAQIGDALTEVAEACGDATTVKLLATAPDRMSRIGADDEAAGIDADRVRAAANRRAWPEQKPGTIVSVPLAALLPLHPGHGLSAPFIGMLQDGSDLFEEVLARRKPAGRLFRDDEMMNLSLVWHRHSCARAAQRALDYERKQLGPKWNVDGLSAREIPYLLTSEVAGVLAVWVDGEMSDAAAAIATSIRSAYWLWLEDDDRAMGVLRTTLEQTARLRTWRRRPDRAAKLEGSERTTPRDWLHAAGWQRLETLNRALGELAHVRVGSRWNGARELLAQLQPEFDEETSIHTARGFCLDTIVSLAGRELLAVTQTVSAPVASVCAALLHVPIASDEGNDAEVEEFMQRAFSHRKTSLGPPSLQGPALKWAADAAAAARPTAN